MGAIVGLADWYASPMKMRSSVFASRALPHWRAVSTLLEASCSRAGNDIGSCAYGKDRSHGMRGDKFGLKLLDCVSYGEFGFADAVSKDQRLMSELGCEDSENLARVEKLAAIWICAIANADDECMGSIPTPPRLMRASAMRRWYRLVGDILGVPSLLAAAKEGVPVKDISA